MLNKLLKITINVILIIMIILLCIYALLRFTNKIEILKVETGSMRDNINVGDYILICKKSNYKVDDIVTYESNGYYITHRIIEIDEDKIITKGDANNVEDSEITKEDIIGKVIVKGGFLNFLIRYKYILIGIFLIIYLITCLFDKKEKKI